MDKPKATPQDFFLWAGAMLSLYAGVIAFLALIFDYINYAYPDTALTYYVDPYQGGVAYEMASLIVLAPLFLMLMRVIRRAIAKDPTRNEVWVRRWSLFLVLFLAGATVAIDLIVLITAFLQGEELTTRFLLKVLVVLLVSGAGFIHFISDLRGYWERKPQYARSVNYAVGLLVLITIGAGFLILGSPQSQRLYRLDNQRIQDLQSIQSQIVYNYQQKQKLIPDLSQLQDSLSYYTVPVDPTTKSSYVFTPKTALSFDLCATFDTIGRFGDTGASMAVPAIYGRAADNWQHAAGQVCFTRTIDPELYPTTNPKVMK